MSGWRLVSVNVGRPLQVGVRRGRPVRSAIGKAPVDGRVRVRGVNVEGDEQADRSVHGGPDKAVYAYGAEDRARDKRRRGFPPQSGVCRSPRGTPHEMHRGTPSRATR